MKSCFFVSQVQKGGSCPVFGAAIETIVLGGGNLIYICSTSEKTGDICTALCLVKSSCLFRWLMEPSSPRQAKRKPVRSQDGDLVSSTSENHGVSREGGQVGGGSSEQCSGFAASKQSRGVGYDRDLHTPTPEN